MQNTESFEDGLNGVVQDLLKVESGVRVKQFGDRRYLCIGTKRIGRSIESFITRAKKDPLKALLSLANTIERIRKTLKDLSRSFLAALWYFGSLFVPDKDQKTWSSAVRI